MAKATDTVNGDITQIANEGGLSHAKAYNHFRKKNEVQRSEKRRKLANIYVYRFIKFYQDYVKENDTVNPMDMAKYIIERWLTDEISLEEDQHLKQMVVKDNGFGHCQDNYITVKQESENSHFGLDTPTSQTSHLVSSPASFLDSAPPFKKRKIYTPDMKMSTFLKHYLSHEETEAIVYNASNKTVTDGDKDEIKQCLVCRGRSTGLHYGKITCEGCKGFFKRAVQSRHLFKCAGPLKDQCNILLERRNSCKRCRFRKCLLIGMAPRAVRENHMPGGRNSQAMYAQDFLESDESQDNLDTSSQSTHVNSNDLPDPSAFSARPNCFHNSLPIPNMMLDPSPASFLASTPQFESKFGKVGDSILKIPQPACLTSEQLKSAMNQAELIGNFMSPNGVFTPMMNANESMKNAQLDSLLMMHSGVSSSNFRMRNLKTEQKDYPNGMSNTPLSLSKYDVPQSNRSIFPFTTLGDPTSIKHFGDILNTVENKKYLSEWQSSFLGFPPNNLLKHNQAHDLPNEVTIMAKEMALVAIQDNISLIEGMDLRPPYCIGLVYQPISELMNERINAWGVSYSRLHEYTERLKQKSVLMFVINAIIHFLEDKQSKYRPQQFYNFVYGACQSPDGDRGWKEIGIYTPLLMRIIQSVNNISGSSGTKHLRILQCIVSPCVDLGGMEDYELLQNLSENLKQLDSLLYQLQPRAFLKLLQLFLEFDRHK